MTRMASPRGAMRHIRRHLISAAVPADILIKGSLNLTCFVDSRMGGFPICLYAFNLLVITDTRKGI